MSASPQALTQAAAISTPFARALGYRSQRRFVAWVATTDIAIIAFALMVGPLLPLPMTSMEWESSLPAFPPTQRYLATAIIALVWFVSMRVTNSYSPDVMGATSQMLRRVVGATLLTVGATAAAGDLLHFTWGRGFFAITFPMGLALLIGSRLVSRQLTLVARRSGYLTRRAIVLAPGALQDAIIADVNAQRDFGLNVVGSVAVPEVRKSAEAERSRTSGPLSPAGVVRALEAAGADTLIVSTGVSLSPQHLRDIRWALDSVGARMMLLPPVLGVSQERLNLQHNDAMALISVSAPVLGGPKRAAKRSLDVIASSIGILLLLPVWIAIALAVKFTDGGQVLFRQKRVGLDGREFPMLKFRTMVVDAEARLAELVAAEEERDAGNAVLFKMREDPRITPVGRFLRRFSLDELPQLFNVWRGEMSLVGPRPPLPAEVALYEESVDRRFMVKPGITGLWQVSGRSNLSWDDSVRLDLFYVENWTMSRDLRILGRTFKAVVGKDGAY